MELSPSRGLYSTVYDPDPEAFYVYQSKCSADSNIKSPIAFPAQVDGPQAWTPASLGQSYKIDLSAIHLQEIEQARESFSATGFALSMINQDLFALPTLSTVLKTQRHLLHEGSGVVLFRGLTLDAYSRKDIIIIFAGISSHMSEKRGLQAAGKILVHVRNLSSIAPTSLAVAPYTNVKLPFHTDYGDVLSMMALGLPNAGGLGILAPVASIYNDIAASRPDLIEVLTKPDWPFDRPVGGGLFERRPILYIIDNKPEMVFSRGGLLRSKASNRQSVMPLLTSEQAEALDMVHFTALKYKLSIEWEKGDIVYFNNRKVLHGRDAFTDNEAEKQARHFLRLWLRDRSLAGPPPPSLQARWNHIFERPETEYEDDGKDNDKWPLEPISTGADALSKRL